jgi:hypothetical protein
LFGEAAKLVCRPEAALAPEPRAQAGADATRGRPRAPFAKLADDEAAIRHSSDEQLLDRSTIFYKRI